MAGGQERVLRRRIKSVESTKKITRAMELIAATRVVKAQERTNAARPYSQQITNVILDLAGLGAEGGHPLLRKTGDAKKAAFVVLTSDRGLCGAYNSAVIRAAERELMARRAEGLDYALILIGKKANSYFRFRNYEIAASFYDLTDRPDYEDARAVSVAVRTMFEEGEVDTVDLVYQRFHSAGSQEVVVRRFLPLETGDPTESATDGPTASMEFEPSPEGILDELLPRYVEARLFAALLDASASEHANRQRAMKAATDNAEELIINLSRVMNRARQDSITGEIMEIVSGAEALHSGKSDQVALPASLLHPESLTNRSA
jgi:F-type H+-transporting ATPase subunit gamma